MSDNQNRHAFAPAGDLERVRWRPRRPGRWRLVVVAGIAATSLLPIAASAGAPDEKLGLPGLTQVVHDLAATVATNTANIASLQSGATTQSGQIALLQHQIDAQQAEIDALQTRVVRGEATGRAYTDAETARASAAEGNLAAADRAGDGGATALAAAKAYTDQQVAAESAARQAADAANAASVTAESTRATGAESSLGSAINGEIARAQAAESALTAALNSEIARAIAGEDAARKQAIISVETSLTTLAYATTGGDGFRQAIIDIGFP